MKNLIFKETIGVTIAVLSGDKANVAGLVFGRNWVFDSYALYFFWFSYNANVVRMIRLGGIDSAVISVSRTDRTLTFSGTGVNEIRVIQFEG